MKHLLKTVDYPKHTTPVRSAHGRHREFLEIKLHGDRVLVKPTTLGRASLNSFWPMWLRHLILTKTDLQHGFAVEVYGDALVVSSDTTKPGLIETVRGIATEIRPLMHVPLKRWNDRNDDNGKSYGPIEWMVAEGQRYIPVALIIDAIPLPRGSHLEVRTWGPWRSDSYGDYCLRLYVSNELLSGREQAMLVELYFALVCCT